MHINKKKIVDIIMWVISISGMCYLLFFIVKSYSDYNKISQNQAFGKAKIIDIYTVRYSDYCKYSFQYKAITYYGESSYDLNYGNIGDSISIIFNQNDPNNNKSIESYSSYSIFKIMAFFLLAILLVWWKLK